MISRLKTISIFIFLIKLSCSLHAQQLVVKDISIEGNKQTKPAIILRELPFVKGDSIPLDSLHNLIQLSKFQLINLNLFNQIELDTQRIEKDLFVVIHVVEKWYLWPIPFVEFADRNFNQWWQFNFEPSRLNYGIYAFAYNVAGLNHTLKLSLIHGYTQNFGLVYRVPYFDKNKKWGLQLGGTYKTNDEIVYATMNNKQQFYKSNRLPIIKRKNAYAEILYRPKLYTTYFAGLMVNNQQIDSVVSVLNEAYASGQNFFTQGQCYLGVNFRIIDNKHYPTKGYSAGAAISANMLLNDNNQQWPEIIGQIEKHNWLSKRTNYSIGLQAQYKFADNLPYPLQQALGYKNYVRGYENYVMDGHAYILGKTTLRYALLHEYKLKTNFIPLRGYKRTVVSSYFTFFLDGGAVKNKFYTTQSGNHLQNTELFGTGIGWDWVFYFDKVIRFEYSFNKNKERGLYIHFSKPL